MAELNFDATTVDPASTFDPVPTGWYPVIITGSETKSTKDTTGSYLELVLKIIDGEYNGNQGWVRLNLNNQNPVAVEIAQRELSAICHAVNVLQVRESQQLHGIPFMARFKLVPAVYDEQGNVKFEAKNDIKGFKPLEGAVASGVSTSDTPSWVTDRQPGEVAAQPAAAAPPATPKLAEPIMTAKADGIAYAEYLKQGWTDELLIEHGYMEVASTPAAPPAAAPPAATTPPAASSKPPWAQ